MPRSAQVGEWVPLRSSVRSETDLGEALRAHFSFHTQFHRPDWPPATAIPGMPMVFNEKDRALARWKRAQL